MAIRRTLGAAVAAAALGAAIAGGGAALAQSDQQINACVSDATGNVRIPQNGGACRANESPLSWSQVGPAGPTGEPGAAGEDADSGLYWMGTFHFVLGGGNCAPDQYHFEIKSEAGPGAGHVGVPDVCRRVTTSGPSRIEVQGLTDATGLQVPPEVRDRLLWRPADQLKWVGSKETISCNQQNDGLQFWCINIGTQAEVQGRLDAGAEMGPLVLYTAGPTGAA